MTPCGAHVLPGPRHPRSRPANRARALVDLRRSRRPRLRLVDRPVARPAVPAVDDSHVRDRLVADRRRGRRGVASRRPRPGPRHRDVQRTRRAGQDELLLGARPARTQPNPPSGALVEHGRCRYPTHEAEGDELDGFILAVPARRGARPLRPWPWLAGWRPCRATTLRATTP